MTDTVKKNRLILVTNDDGVDAKGIKFLTEIALQYGDVVVIAPDKGKSGMSHSVSLNEPIYIDKLSEKSGLEIYACSGTPADSVKIALHKILNRKPDLILSGINHGSNASVSAIYSGTVAAAREGSMNGITSIAFSLLSHDPAADFTAAAKYVQIIIEKVLQNGIAKQTCLNVNIPNVPEDKIKGIKTCRQTLGKWIEEFDYRVNPHNKDYYWLTGKFSNFEPTAEDTDEWALNNNYVAIVPIEVDLTSYTVLKDIKNWDFNI
jgi:5'-nucleotidase